MHKSSNTLKSISSKSVLQEHLGSIYFPSKKPVKRFHLKIIKKRFYLIFALAAFVVIASSGYFLFKTGFLALPAQERTLDVDAVRAYVRDTQMVKITDGGKFNPNFVEDISFGGYAKAVSKKSQDYIALTNSKKYRWANLNINFKCPIDISGKNLLMLLKGKQGGEKIRLVLKDTAMRAYTLRDAFLTADWDSLTIPINAAGKTIDMARIKSLRVECDYPGEPIREKDSNIETAVFIKNIYLEKAE